MIAIVDYGMGNVASVTNAFKRLGYEVILTDNKDELHNASHIILPGVGSFQAAIKEIEERGLKETLKQLATEKPFLGICLGMQLLFTTGYENGVTEGLDIIPGTVEKIKTEYLLPHIGWNSLDIKEGHPNFNTFQDKHVYFVHTYEARTEDKYLVATTDYGSEVPGIVRKDRVFGIQFHPEKSGDIGLDILKEFIQSTN
jgi:imidazole glycerol-phosphate synthase subunit HisH